MYIYVYMYTCILGRSIRARTMRAQRAHNGPANKNPGGPTRAQFTSFVGRALVGPLGLLWAWPLVLLLGVCGKGSCVPSWALVTQGPRRAHKVPVHKSPRGLTRARPTRAQGGQQGPGP